MNHCMKYHNYGIVIYMNTLGIKYFFKFDFIKNYY